MLITTPPNQSGITLIVSLVMLLIVLMLSTSLANMTLMAEKAARNERDKHIAMHAAEAALADAEMDIENSASPTSRSAIFSPYSMEGFSDGCGRGDGNLYQGLCTAHQSGQQPIWLRVDLANDSASVALGRFTGKTMPSGAGPFPSKLPRYIIELIPDHAIGQAARTLYMYRITAIGFGTDRATQVLLQSVYRKSAH